MKIDDLKVGDKVRDTWFNSWWGEGTVVEVLKTRVKIDFSIKGMLTFDLSHLRYLEKIEK